MNVSPIISVQISVQALTFFLSMIYIFEKNMKIVYLLRFVFFLALLVECIGAYCMKIGTSSFYYHYFYTFLNFSLIMIFYSEIIKDRSRFKFIKLLMVVFYFLGLLSLFRRSVFTYFFITGALIVSISVVFYLRELLLSDRILNYKKLFPFWVSVGFLVFYISSVPFFSMLTYMHNRGLFSILNILIILMNLIIIYGLITCSKEEKY